MDALETADALAVTELSRRVWNDTVSRGHFPEAPRTTTTKARTFYRDDLVALTILKVLLDLRMQASFAGSITSQIRIKLRKRADIDELFLAIATGKNGKTSPKVVDQAPQDGCHPLVFRIAVYRRQAEINIARILASKGAS